MINLELSGKHAETLANLRQVAEHMMRPYSRKYDKAEHDYPEEMEAVAKIIASARPAASAKSAPANPSLCFGNIYMIQRHVNG